MIGEKHDLRRFDPFATEEFIDGPDRARVLSLAWVVSAGDHREAGIFDEVGLDVELRYFVDYLTSIDAMATGELAAVTQTLNDTMASVAFGDEQVIVIVNDNSTGNDKIICDGSITSIEDLAGKTIAAEAGAVDHFLLVQGLQSVGLTEADIDFRGLPTDAAAASFAAGEFDCVGVFAPFWLTALEREGSAELFSSADFPGLIPDHIVASNRRVPRICGRNDPLRRRGSVGGV